MHELHFVVKCLGKKENNTRYNRYKIKEGILFDRIFHIISSCTDIGTRKTVFLRVPIKHVCRSYRELFIQHRQ